MADVKQTKPTSAKITDQLRNLPTGRTAAATVTVNHRTVTNVYSSGFQAQRGDVVKQGGRDDG